MVAAYRGAIVVVALIVRLDRSVRLRWQGRNDVREHVVGQPSCPVVGGLACPHPVTRHGRVAYRAGSGLALVVPDREECASVADGKIGLPLKASSRIAIQFEWRAESDPTISGADVVDVTRVRAVAVLGVDEANYVVVGRRLTPAHVTPGVRTIHAHEIGIGGAISAAGGLRT